MTTTVLATALPHSLADDAPFQLTVFFTHKLAGAGDLLSGYPAAERWVDTLAGCTLTLSTSLDPAALLPLRVVSTADAGAWLAVLPPGTPVQTFPTPQLSGQTWHTLPASRMSDHAVDLHLAAIAAAPTRRPSPADDPVATSLLETLATLDQGGPLHRLLDEERARPRHERDLPDRRLQDALTTLGPLTPPEDLDPLRGHGRELPPLPPYQSEPVDRPSPVQVLLEDREADLRVTRQLDGLVGQDLSADPQLRMVVDAHAVRRYYERPQQPRPDPQREPDPDAPPSPRPERPAPDFHARVASFGSTPVLLRRLGLAVDVVLDGVDAAGARAALAGATWVSVGVRTDHPDLEVLPPRRTAVTVDGQVFAARSSRAWVGGALPLGEDDWVVLDTDPDASGLKLDQHTRNLPAHYASAANGDPATSAPGTLRSTGFALARRDRADQLRARVQEAEQLAADDGRDLLLDDLVRGIRVEVWDDRTRAWHSLHRRRVDVTAAPGGAAVLTDAEDVGFLQLSALNAGPGGPAAGYYLHEVVAGWDGWSLSAPRPGRVVVHVEPPGPDGSTETVADAPPDEPLDGAHVVSRVEPGTLPRLRYGMSYSFRVLAVDLAGNSVPQVPPHLRLPWRPPAPEEVDAARTHLGRLRESYLRRDGGGLAAALRESVLQRAARRQGALQEQQARADQRPGPGEPLPTELRSAHPLVDSTLATLLTQAAGAGPGVAAAQRRLDEVTEASAVLAARTPWRVRPQLAVDPGLFAELARQDDLRLPPGFPALARPTVTAPRPYLRWEPVPPPAVVPRRELGTGEQPAHLVVRSGLPAGAVGPGSTERHLAPPKATQLEAEAAGRFDTAIGTGDAAEIRRQYAIAVAERGTLLDQRVPSLDDPRATEEQPGIALVDRPGADTGSAHRATLDQITADRGRPIGEGQYVVHDVDALRLPYLPDPYAAGVTLTFTEAGAPHALAEPRVLQSVSIPYPGSWPSLQPLRLVVEAGEALDARVEDHEVRVTLPPGEQVRVVVSSTLRTTDLDRFGLWRSHLASVADPADGFTPDEVVASASLMRAAASGWTWWLTPSTDIRLVHAVPTPVRPPQLSALSLFARPPGRAVAALSGLVDVHGPSTDLLRVRASWSEWVDDPAADGPQQVTRSDVVVRSPVGERERRGVLFLYDHQPTGALAQRLGGMGLHQMLQTFPDTHHRRVSYVPSGTTRYAEYFEPGQIPEPEEGTAVVLDIPSSARPAAPVVLDAVPLLRWSAEAEPGEPFGWRRTRRSGVRVWLDRPWFSSGDGELLGVLVADPDEWTRAPDGSWSRTAKEQPVPDGATSLWAADPILVHGGQTSDPTVPPLLAIEHLVLDLAETGAAEAFHQAPPLGGRAVGGADRGWPEEPGLPVAAAAAVPLRDVSGHPVVRVLGYRPEYDPASRRWFVDVALQDTPALWPFVRLAVARYQPQAIEGCSLSPTALTGWVQPLPGRTLTVTRPDADHAQVTLTGAVSWLRFDLQGPTELTGDQLSADSPTGDAVPRAVRLLATRTVRVSVQGRPKGAGDLEWVDHTWVELVAVSVQEDAPYAATWTGTVDLPAAQVPLRRPGQDGSTWRLLVEEQELLDADPTPEGREQTTPRLVYADAVLL